MNHGEQERARIQNSSPSERINAIAKRVGHDLLDTLNKFSEPTGNKLENPDSMPPATEDRFEGN